MWTGKIGRVEIITSVRRRRRWSVEEGADRSGDVCVGDIGVAPGPAARDRARTRCSPDGGLYGRAVGSRGRRRSGAPSEYRALQHQVRELQRLLGKKTLENEVLRDALDLAQPKKRLLLSRSPAPDGTP